MDRKMDELKMIKKIEEIALVLSGGGARGAIHLGVLQALDDYNIKVKAVSGTSIGSVIGVLYCAGMSPKEIRSFMHEKIFTKIFNFSWSNNGLLNMNRLIKLLTELIPNKTFENLDIPFYSCVANLDSGVFEILKDGDLYKSAAASASIPIIFDPLEINGNFYVDGGLFNNLPVEPLLDYDNVVGVHVNNYKPDEEVHFKSSAEKIFTHVIKSNVKPRLEKCDFVIEPYIDRNIGVLNFSETEFLYNLGYKSAKELIEKEFVPV